MFTSHLLVTRFGLMTLVKVAITTVAAQYTGVWRSAENGILEA